jgi:hypothetical protein
MRNGQGFIHAPPEDQSDLFSQNLVVLTASLKAIMRINDQSNLDQMDYAEFNYLAVLRQACIFLIPLEDHNWTQLVYSCSYWQTILELANP